MEDEIIDIFIVLGCLTVGVFGGIVLILKYSNAMSRVSCPCMKKKKEDSIATTSPSPKRMTIKIARPPSRVAPVQRPGHLAISRMKSAPIPEIVHSPCAGEANSCFSSDIESGLHRQAVFIMATAGKTYKAADAHSVLSAQHSSSTQSSYLPNQLNPLPKRRGSF